MESDPIDSENAKGGDGNDYLKGNNLDNELEGGKGNDTLEGGAGKDTYIYTTEAGKVDTITDSDNGTGNSQGSVKFDKSTLTGGKNKSKGSLTWYDNADNPTYTYNAASDPNAGPVTLTITSRLGGTVTVNNFKNHDLGIHLVENSVTPTQTTRDILGDLKQISSIHKEASKGNHWRLAA